MLDRYPSEATRAERRRRFPLGAGLETATLDEDPYPHLARLRADEPVSWIDSLGMWYVTRHEDVRALLADSRLGNDSPHSPVRDTFGPQMLSADGAEHTRWRGAAQRSFGPALIRARLEPAVRAAARRLIAELRPMSLTELRESFAARLPVLTVLAMCGLDPRHEPDLRRWYTDFGAALANFGHDERIREAACSSVRELHAFIAEAIAGVGYRSPPSLLTDLTAPPAGRRLSDEEIIRNLSIIFFGGISTVEALILTTLWAFATHPAELARALSDFSLLPAAIEEAARWHSPVQSATRHVLVDELEFQGVQFLRGEIVNCMLGSANRDMACFPEPDSFTPGRTNIGHHLAFASGTHACLGFRVARLEVTIALEEILAGLPNLEIDLARSSPPRGLEFHQPPALFLRWSTA